MNLYVPTRVPDKQNGNMCRPAFLPHRLETCDMSSSTSFERYNEEFQSLSEQVSSKLSSLWTKAESGDGASSSSKSSIDDTELKMVQDLLVQADDIIKQMGLEARSVNENGMKKELLGKVRNVII